MVTAQIVHELPGRLRLRIPDKRKDAVFFNELKANALALDGIEQVFSDPLTGSLLIRHLLNSDEIRNLFRNRLNLTLEAVVPARPSSALAPLSTTVSIMDQGLRRATGGVTDLRVLIFLLLVALAIRQILRGQVMVPAAALLWNAFVLVLHKPFEN